MDKVRSRELFQKAGLSVPRCVVLNSHSQKRGKHTCLSSDVCLPYIVKPSSQGSSIGLSLVDTKDKLKKAIGLAYKYDDTVIVEEYISGKEVTVAILNDKPLPVVHIVPGNRFYDYNAKYKSNSTRYICPANLGRREYKHIQESALIAHKCLGCKSFSRVDMILKEDGTPVVLEVNTIPGLTSKSLLPKAAKAAGISFEKLCLKILPGISKGVNLC
jgi:D-alanine-D-alanine ligase